MYKIRDVYTKDIWLGTKEAVIKFADDKFCENRDEEWIQEYHKKLGDIGFVVKRIDGIYYTDHIDNFELAVKYLQRIEDMVVVDIGDILEELKNNEPILISQEE